MQLVTVCLITWKRQYNIPQIMESLLKWPFVGQICLLDNSRGKNYINYGRYLQAEKAEYDLIYTQDDDCIINNLGDVYSKFIENTDTLTHSGTTEYQEQIPKHTYGEHQMAMAGWGMFFSRPMMRVLKRYTDRFGEDYCFYRETDRIFSLLLKTPHNFVLGDIINLKGKDDQFALCNQIDHIKNKRLAIERALLL